MKGLDKDKQKPKSKKSPKEEEKKPEDKKHVASNEIEEANETNKSSNFKEAATTKNKIKPENISSKANLSKHKEKLLDSEIIEPDAELTPKQPVPNLVDCLILSKLKDLNVEVETFKNIEEDVEAAMRGVTNKIKENKIRYTTEEKTVEEILTRKQNKSQNGDKVEEAIRQQRLKETLENKESLENKIKQLDNNMKLLEDEAAVNVSKFDLNASTQGKEIIDENIRKSRIKEIKQSKEVLENKLTALEDQVRSLMEEEEANSQVKKFNIKQYLDNFEKNKHEVELRVKDWQEKRKDRERHLKEMGDKKEKQLKKREEMQRHLLLKKQQEKEEKYKKKLEELITSGDKRHKEIENIREDWKNKSKNNITEDYRYIKYEEKFKMQQNKLEEERRNKELSELMKKRAYLKPINREELDEFSRKYQEDRERLMMEKEKERLAQQEELFNRNEKMPKSESQAYQRILEEEKQFKRQKEEKDLDIFYKNQEKKNMANVIKECYAPKVNEELRREMQERVEKMRSRSKNRNKSKKKRNRILLKKADPNKAHKYKWKLKLNSSLDTGEKRRSRSPGSSSPGNDVVNTEGRKKSRSYEKRKPLNKAPDYLTQMRVKKNRLSSSNALDKKDNDKKWEKMIANDKYSLVENVEQVKIKAHQLEEQAKMKEKFLQLNGGAEKNPDMGEDVSNMLIDSIKAKLTILDSISKKK